MASSWYDSDWNFRVPISIDNTGGGTTVSITETIPSSLVFPWVPAQEDGDDLWLTEADGITLISAGNASAFDLGATTFSKASRTGSIRVDQWTGATASAHNMLWLYVGNTTATSAAFGTWSSPTATVNAYFAKESVKSRPRVVVGREDLDATTPRAVFTKASTETIYLYWDFSGVLFNRDRNYEQFDYLEGIASATIQSKTGGAGASVHTATDLLWVGSKGDVIRTAHPSGASGTDYVLILTVVTTEGRTLDARALLKVQDVDETP